jgi:hypothetical protein
MMGFAALNPSYGQTILQAEWRQGGSGSLRFRSFSGHDS